MFSSSSSPTAIQITREPYAWRIFPRLVAACFASALLSFLVQYDGLSSSRGLEPWGDVNLSIGGPWILNLMSLMPRLGLSLDDGARALALAGTAVSLFAACAPCGPRVRGVFLVGAWAAYTSLVRAGDGRGPWMGYQWDNLLLEAGAAAVAAVPWVGGGAPPPARVLVRLLAFKLLFMSGATKLQAGDALWANLKALDIHFASQPLPTPIAWFLHNLPPLLLSAATAFSLWAELVGAALLLAPCARARRVGAASNVALQLLIFLSGNYNFFNLLTIGLLAAASAPIGGGARACGKRRGCAATALLAWGEALLLAIVCLGSVSALFSLKIRPPVMEVPATAAALAAATAGYAAASATVNATTTANVHLIVPWWARLELAVSTQWVGGGGGEIGRAHV